MTTEERKECFRTISPLPNEYETEMYLEALDSIGFFEAPASTKYHGAYPGGLFDHCLNMYNAFTYELEDAAEDAKIESLFKISFFHDICKCDAYNKTETGYEYNKSQLFDGHGSKSVMLCALIGVALTEEEAACIRYHMGAFSTDKEEWSRYTNAIHKYPLVLWTHTADMIAAHIKEI